MATTGPVTDQGVLRGGRGVLDLVIPDGDPQRRRNLTAADWLQITPYQDQVML
ncbi:hypothetical protein [Streptomyces sp. NPDC046727]|uniref:hypothetical protein n=1 Tax=Streptomyces sp. NPDC046727 TaxID=3155373 RepID=UPI0033EE46E5